MGEIKLSGYLCDRCNHTWISRGIIDRPVVCPKCKSPYWDVPRKNNFNKNIAKGIGLEISDKGGELFPTSSKEDSGLFPK